MEPPLKQLAVDIVKRHGKDAWSVDCCLELSRALAVPMKDLPALQTSIFCAIDDPTHLHRGMEEDRVEPVVPEEVQQLESNRVKANADLSLFQRCPEGMVGEELFDHSVRWLQCRYHNKPKEYELSSYLAVSPCNHHQQALLSLDYHQRVMGSLADDLKEGVPKRKAVQCHINNFGHWQSHSKVINNPQSIWRGSISD